MDRQDCLSSMRGRYADEKLTIAVVLLSLIPMQANALDTDAFPGLVAMPLAVGTVQLVEVLRYVPVALEENDERKASA